MPRRAGEDLTADSCKKQRASARPVSHTSDRDSHWSHAARETLSPQLAPPRHPVSGDAIRIQDLLPMFLKKIFYYAADVSYITPGKHSLRNAMPALGLVCHRWREFVGALDRSRAQAKESLEFRSDHVDALDAMYSRLETAKRGANVRWLTLAMGAMTKSLYEPQFVLYEGLGSLERIDALAIDWPRIFRACPRLLRLDLSLLPLETLHTRGILAAASTHCGKLQALALPYHEVKRVQSCNYDADNDDSDGRVLLATMDALYDALRAWRMSGTGHGLRQLSVPKRHHKSEEFVEARAGEWLCAVAAHCPNIEYLDGWKASYDDRYTIDCDDFWKVSSDAWATFCRACTRLREFNWTCVPLEDAFLLEFGRHVKPALTKMMVTGDIYKDNVGMYSELFDRTLRFEFDSVLAMLRACPALEELQFMFQGWGCTPSQCLQEQLTNGALRAIAAVCPRLKRIFIDEIPGKYSGSPMPHVTDAGLLALAAMPDLEHIALKQTDCSAQGFLSLIVHAPRPQLKRRVVIKVGWRLNGDDEDISFFSAVVEYIKFVVTMPPASLQGRCFELEFVNDYAWHEHDFDAMHATLVALRARLGRRHRDVRMLFREQGVLSNRLPKDVRYIDGVALASPKSASIWPFPRLFETKWTPSIRSSYM